MNRLMIIICCLNKLYACTLHFLYQTISMFLDVFNRHAFFLWNQKVYLLLKIQNIINLICY